MSPTIRRILCVDDDDPTCDLLQVLFSHLGYQVTTVVSPREAQALLARTTFHLYILDTQFPKGSGLNLCRALRKRTPTVPVVFYSSATQDEVQAAGVRAGATACVPKPHIEELIKVVEHVLEGQAATAPQSEESEDDGET